MHTPFFQRILRAAGRGPWLLAALTLGGCAAPLASLAPAPATTVAAAAWPEALAHTPPTDVLVLGEQHDAAEHQHLQRTTVQWLAQRGRLAALVMEMAERGHSTAGLAPQASEAQVREALQWQDAAWPWHRYGPAVMAAVQAGAVVHGGNLPRRQMREAMADTRWDTHLPPPALQRQYAALREGHCDLLPAAQIPPMARIQIARDASLAATALQARHPGRTVLLVVGNGHALRSLGVPTHWSPDTSPKWTSKVALAQSGKALAAIKNEADVIIETAALPPSDPCKALREQWKARPPAQPS